MNTPNASPSVHTNYLADLALGHQLRARAVRNDMLRLINLPRRLTRYVAQRFGRSNAQA